MKLKTVEVNGQTYAAIHEGKPVYVHDDGKEVPFDAPGTVATISRLNGEAKGHREGKEQALERLKLFDGIDDPEAARKALSTLSNLDAKKLVDAGEVEKVKSEAIKAVEEKYAPRLKELESIKKQYVDEKLNGSFARSKFITDKVAAPLEMMQATFGHNFKVEGGDLIGYYPNGEKIFSRSKPGEIAGFDEALETLVSMAPFSDRILKGTGANGSGARGGGEGGNGKQVSRAIFDAMPLEAQGAHVRGGGTVVD